jgi:beta-galactosidase
MEQQCGQINWAVTNPLPSSGAVALWTAQAWGHGANVVSYFRWRAATMAQELMHSGVLRHDESLDRGGDEIKRFDLAQLPNDPISTPVVLLHDYESLWAYDLQPHNQAASYWRQFLLFYRALRSLGIDVDIRHPDSDLSSYRLIVAPALQLMPESRAARLADHAGQAELIFGPRTAYRTRSGRVHEDGQPGPLLALTGYRLLNVDGIPRGSRVTIGAYSASTWAESYRPTTGVATHLYSDGPLSGTAAVIRHGKVTSIGAWSESLITDLLEAALQRLGIPSQHLPDGVRVSRRGHHELWTNFTEQPIEINGLLLAPGSYDIRSLV